MKVILTILCAIVVLFGGGCGLVMVASSGMGGMFAAGGFALLPFGLAALNVLVIGALWGKIRTRPWAFLALAILDGAIVILMILPWLAIGLPAPQDRLFFALPILILTVKGVLTFLYWRRL